ncbi:MAG: carboxypeptidase regulatory-like domain-containing protein [Flavobacteriales bacterium]|nr:carboxypeptidase regulatory-like domain-containing protein [Flavobacteriales bacterium]
MLRLRHFLFAFLLVYASTCEAVEVAGFVRDGITGLPLRGAIVTLEGAGTASKQQVTRIDGFYSFDVRAGQRVVIRFAADGRNGRYVVFDAMAVPREWNDALVNELHIRLFPPMEGVDSAILAAPAASFAWNEEKEAVLWDTAGADALAERWKAIAEDHLARHPEDRPTTVERCTAEVFDRIAEERSHANKWLVAAAFALAWALYVLLDRLVRKLAMRARLAVLAAFLAGSIALIIDLASVAGPLRFLAFFGLLAALVSGGRLALGLLLGTDGRTDPDVGAELHDMEVAMHEEDMQEEEEDVATDAVDHASRPDARARLHAWVPLGVALLAGSALVAEWSVGLENTLRVWRLVGGGVLLGLAIAALVARGRTPAMLRTRPQVLFWNGGVWWFALPLLCVAAASFVNRSLPQGEEHCDVWPVVEVWDGRKGIQVRVEVDGERERLEMDRAIKEQLTTLDSLRCCHRRGALGLDFVERIEPVIAASVPR